MAFCCSGIGLTRQPHRLPLIRLQMRSFDLPEQRNVSTEPTDHQGEGFVFLRACDPDRHRLHAATAIQTLKKKKAATKNTKNTNGKAENRGARGFAPLLLRSASRCTIIARVLRESAPVYHVERGFTDALSRRTHAMMSAGGRSSRGAKARARQTYWRLSWTLPCRFVSLSCFSCHSWLFLPCSV